MEEHNNKQDICIAQLQKDVEWIRIKIESLTKSVTNEIPHQIKDLDKKFAIYREKQGKWLIGILVSILMLLLGIIFNIVISFE